MKNKFLPKALDGKGGSRACLNIGLGCYSTEPHFHDCTEIIYMKKGKARVFCDCEWLDLFEGDTLLVPEGRIHCTFCDDEGSERVVIGFQDALIAQRTDEEYYSLLPFLRGEFNMGYVISAKKAPQLSKKLDALFLLAQENDAIDTLTLYSEIIGVYRVFLYNWQEKGLCQAQFSENKTVRAIEDYMRANAHLRITAQDVAKHVNVSYSYMARLLSEAGVGGFCDYLLSVRVDMAKKMLTSTEMSVTDVGYECGFPATSAFIQSFKRITGKTPLSYRKTVKSL